MSDDFDIDVAASAQPEGNAHSPDTSSGDLGLDLTDLTIDQLIERYIEIRDELDDERKKYNYFEASAKDMMARLSMAMKEFADKNGKLQSIAGIHGTAYRSLKESFRVGKWEDILEYIKTTGNFQMLEKRIAKLATQEIYRSTGELPPGVEYVAEEEFLVRRPKSK